MIVGAGGKDGDAGGESPEPAPQAASSAQVSKLARLKWLKQD
jgi:hypothetical protein